MIHLLWFQSCEAAQKFWLDHKKNIQLSGLLELFTRTAEAYLINMGFETPGISWMSYLVISLIYYIKY